MVFQYLEDSYREDRGTPLTRMLGDRTRSDTKLLHGKFCLDIKKKIFTVINNCEVAQRSGGIYLTGNTQDSARQALG